MEFAEPAGWHVIIGDNGAGKSTVVRSIALALIGPKEALGLRSNWKEWLNHREDSGCVGLYLENDELDRHKGRQAPVRNQYIPNVIVFERKNGTVDLTEDENLSPNPFRQNWGQGAGWFSAAYGPFRRFDGGNPEWSKVFYAQPKLGAHLSIFGEDVALSEALDWLVKLNYLKLEKRAEGNIIEDLIRLVNSEDFLPHGAKMESVSSDGVFFRDGNGTTIPVTQLSDGYRSILSLTFELIRQLVRVFGADLVFQQIRKDKMVIDLPGVVLIDEIDAHLHPTWQTRIGDWFTKYFPKIQFIVTTHSPLVCRAGGKGSIWRLAAPGSAVPSGEITGLEKDRLVLGNVLDAYGTELFGKSPVRSVQSNEKLERLGRLNMLYALGKATDEEIQERAKLQLIFTTDDPTGF